MRTGLTGLLRTARLWNSPLPQEITLAAMAKKPRKLSIKPEPKRGDPHDGDSSRSTRYYPRGLSAQLEHGTKGAWTPYLVSSDAAELLNSARFLSQQGQGRGEGPHEVLNGARYVGTSHRSFSATQRPSTCLLVARERLARLNLDQMSARSQLRAL